VHRILKDVLRDSAEFTDKQPDAKGTAHEVPVGRGSVVDEEKKSPWSKSSTEQTAQAHSATSAGHASSAAERRQKVAHGVSRGKRADHDSEPRRGDRTQDNDSPIPLEDLHEIADSSSQSERRADDAERELMDWKKARFMMQHVGDEFEGMIVSVTKFGLFVELHDLFIEGLVPLNTLEDDKYFFNEDTRQIIGQSSKRTFSLGDTVHVIVDRIDPVEKKINFAMVEEEPKRRDKKRKKAR